MIIESLDTRVAALDLTEILALLKFNANEKPSPQARLQLNAMVCEKIESGEIDEIELILIESGN